jgi:hypothetical protein
LNAWDTLPAILQARLFQGQPTEIGFEDSALTIHLLNLTIIAITLTI